MDLTLLTPLGALIAVVVVVPLVALSLLHRRGRSIRRAVGLPEPRPRVMRAAVAALVGAAPLLGLAAAPPRLEWAWVKRRRDDVHGGADHAVEETCLQRGVARRREELI